MAHFGVLRNALVTVAGTEYQAKVKTASLTPEVNKQEYRTLVPAGVEQDVDAPVWSLQLVGLQDWGTDGLAKYLHDHHGEEVSIELAPKNTLGEPLATVTVVSQSSQFGGNQGEFAETDVTLGVVGQPVFGSVAS